MVKDLSEKVPSIEREDELRPDLSTVAKRNAFYASDEYRSMTTAEKCALQRDWTINDYD